MPGIIYEGEWEDDSPVITNVIKLVVFVTRTKKDRVFLTQAYPSLIFEIEAGSLPPHFHNLRCSDIDPYSFFFLESSLLEHFNNYGQKQFYNIGTRGQCYKIFYIRNLRIFIIS